MLIPQACAAETATAQSGPVEGAQSRTARATISHDVFSVLVQASDDFLGLLAYALYKRHKIEWIQSHPEDDHEAFKKVACTPQQITMYKRQAELMAKNFIDVSMEQLGEQMRISISEDLLITRFDIMQPAIARKIDELKPSFWKNVSNHTLSGIASVTVALGLFGVFSLYADYQKKGGLEGTLNSLFNPVTLSAPSPVETAQPAPALQP